MLAKFCDKYFEINASHFSKGAPPMVFKDAYTLAQDMLRDAGHRADPLSVGELEKLHQVDKPPRVHPKREEKPRGEREREKRPNKTKDGDEICYGYNSAKGCAEGQKAGVLPGGHCSKNGRKYAHVCSHYDFATKEICQKNHVRTNNHK
jgi:hypothetical protein